jgi:hypothetical protein
VSVDVVPVTLVGFAETVIPLGAFTATVTGSANPLILVIVVVAVVLPPGATTTGDGETESAIAGAMELNVAVTTLPKSFGVNVQVSAVPAQTPVQLTKALTAAGAAVSVIGPRSNCALHAVPQVIPAGLEVTVPDPKPALTMLTPGRPFLTVRLSDGRKPSSRSESVPTRPANYGIAPLRMFALLAAVSVTVLDPLPVSVAGLKVAVIPGGRPLTPRVIVPGDEPLSASDRVVVPLWP